MSEKPLNEYIDLEAYDVVPGDVHRALTAALERAERERDARGDAAVREAKRCDDFRKRWEEREREWAVEHDRAEAAEARAQKAEARLTEECKITDDSVTLRYQLEKAEAVIEAARRIAAAPSRTDNEDEKLIAQRALTAYDEPPTEEVK